MDLETLITRVYVVVDDWYKEKIEPHKRQVGRRGRLSDSEVLALAIVGQWRVGVPWQSERGMVRYMQAHGRELFPAMIGRSGFNRRARHIWGVLVRLQQDVAEWLTDEDVIYECVDSLPLSAYRLSERQRGRRHWLWDARIGIGPEYWFWGYRLLTSVTSQGVITGWLIGAADVQERWLMEALVSARAGRLHCRGPQRGYVRPKRRALPPVSYLGPALAAGRMAARPFLADQAFNSSLWQQHWYQHYHATVISLPPPLDPIRQAWLPSHRRWIASHRQSVETVFAILTHAFGLKRLLAHSRWGLITRLASTMAAFNLAIWLNRQTGAPDLAIASLIT